MLNASAPNALIGGPNPNSPGFPLKTCGNDGLEVQQTAQISLAIIGIARIMDFRSPLLATEIISVAQISADGFEPLEHFEQLERFSLYLIPLVRVPTARVLPATFLTRRNAGQAFFDHQHFG